MGLFSKLFGSKGNGSQRPRDHEIVVHFSYGSTNFQHVYALEDQIRTVINDAHVGGYDGHDIAQDGSKVSLHMYGPDAEKLYGVISPLLAESLLMHGATVTLWFGPQGWKTQKRVIVLP